MTLWYGAALGVVLVFFSAATYLRYRQEAWRSFDVDLRNNLDTLDGEMHEEMREARARTAAGRRRRSLLWSAPRSSRSRSSA